MHSTHVLPFERTSALNSDGQMKALWRDAAIIIEEALSAVDPYKGVCDALGSLPDDNKSLFLLAVGKAAFQMAKAVYDTLGDAITEGMVITKDGHLRGSIGPYRLFEAGHPLPDRRSYRATREALRMADRLTERDRLILLLSGGGSSLFESSALDITELRHIQNQLLCSGLPIEAVNTVRKHLSDVKGGRFALRVLPADLFSVILSDVISERRDVIASGPATPDPTTSRDALSVLRRAGVHPSEAVRSIMRNETPKTLPAFPTKQIGSNSALCKAAADAATALGYHAVLSDRAVTGDAATFGRDMGRMAQKARVSGEKKAFIVGGETTVHVTGTGLGGRNQEIVLAAVPMLDGLSDLLLFSLASDGTDGPTDAAGGIVDGETARQLRQAGYGIETVLRNNDSYHALESVGALLRTGPTGTNVNDLTVLLINP